MDNEVAVNTLESVGKRRIHTACDRKPMRKKKGSHTLKKKASKRLAK